MHVSVKLAASGTVENSDSDFFLKALEDIVS
jgi:hypothetical protein